MKKYFLRSTIFNFSFYAVTLAACFAFLPFLVLPRRHFLAVVSVWLNIVECLEKHVMGITCELRGLEHLPKKGPYLVAAKHQSQYETFKLRQIFDDPAIILKKELLRIGERLKLRGALSYVRPEAEHPGEF